MLIVVKMKSPSAAEEGWLRRYFLRLDATLYVGNASRKMIDHLKSKFQGRDVKIVIEDKKCPLGLDLFFGLNPESFGELDGILLPKKR